MDLINLGYNQNFEKYIKENKLSDFEIGRVTAEHKERYTVCSANGEYDAEITGNMRFTAQGREDFPAVGDWVAMMVHDTDFAIIHSVLPRFSLIKRQAVGQFGEVQIIAANIDYAFLVQAADRDFNINRLERYLTLCNSSKVSPIIILNKIDLIDEQLLAEIINSIKARIDEVPIIAISNESKQGLSKIQAMIEPGKTYCMLGSSGVGKSTLLNNLVGRQLMQTNHISFSNNKGRHVTSHRELIVLDSGGIIIDNPGMREVGIADSSDGLEITFDRIISLGHSCKFKDCTHTVETGCAVLQAIDCGEIDRASYENYLKMEREKTWFESTQVERRKRDKEFGKMVKSVKKIKGIGR